MPVECIWTVDKDTTYMVSMGGFRWIAVGPSSTTEIVREGDGDAHWRVVYPGGLGVLAFVRLELMTRAWRGHLWKWRHFPHDVRLMLNLDGGVLLNELFGDLASQHDLLVRINRANDGAKVLPFWRTPGTYNESLGGPGSEDK